MTAARFELYEVLKKAEGKKMTAGEVAHELDSGQAIMIEKRLMSLARFYKNIFVDEDSYQTKRFWWSNSNEDKKPE